MPKKETFMQKLVRIFTPDKIYAWSLALYPITILAGMVFVLVVHNEVTTELVALMVGLLTAGTLNVAVKKKEKEEVNDDSTSNRNVGAIRGVSRSELDESDRRGTDNPNRRLLVLDGLYWRFLQQLSV